MSCIVSSLQRAFLRHPFPSGRIRRLSRSRLVQSRTFHTGNFDTPDGDKTRRALLKFFRGRGVRARLSTTFNFRYLFGQPSRVCPSFFLDKLCLRTRNNYQSPFLPLPVKNRRKEARRGKKGETIVGERKETKRLTFTLPSRTKFPLHLPSISSTDSYRFLGNLAILSLFTQRYRNNGRQRLFVSHYHPTLPRFRPFFPRCRASLIG